MAQTAAKRASGQEPVVDPDGPVDRSTLEDKLGFRIRMAERRIYRDFVQSVDMTPVQYSVFALVAENEGMSQGVIGEALNMDRASTMAIMDKLEKAGLIERKKSPIDRRRHALYLTAKGRKEITAVEKKVRKTDDAFKQRLSDRQLRDLVRYLDILGSG
ncbi:MarR family winged helix-turn-helix transcriptional regulator [Microbulbifer taiwanensis]|uniref:MarR family winged helix-turn-helix transcriptional regulator n=1 Tax=Microbulbifer taiwanensis TaxID=986746 RepID=A0ABW1YKL4_9GAMM|nr:MarR family winged helix-turn-helix transcriptional regulator [Microbulbifer taiwanensis]